VSLAIASWYAWRSHNAGLTSTGHELATRNPLNLWFASRFGMLLALIMILSRAAKELLGNRGLFALSGISGLVDVDAITLSAASMFNLGQMKLSTAAIAILLPAAVNTLVKPALMTAIAGVRASMRVWLALLAGLGAGGLACWFEVLR
jgi:uncharacterized membrane protein (DUF4010 family)